VRSCSGRDLGIWGYPVPLNCVLDLLAVLGTGFDQDPSRPRVALAIDGMLEAKFVFS